MASGEPEEKLKIKKPMKLYRHSHDEMGFFEAAYTIRWGFKGNTMSCLSLWKCLVPECSERYLENRSRQRK